MEDILKRLQEKELTLNIDTCNFNMDKIEFMRHILSAHGIGVSQSKVDAVVQARRPESTSEVRSFLGLVNFVARFIPDLATKAVPLHRLLHKDAKFRWGPEQEKSFNQLKQSLVVASNLSYFDLNAETQVIADASPVGLGVVLVQKAEQRIQSNMLCKTKLNSHGTEIISDRKGSVRTGMGL